MAASDVSQGVAIQLTIHGNSVSLAKAVHAHSHRLTEASRTDQQTGLMEISTRQVILAHGALPLAAMHMPPEEHQ